MEKNKKICIALSGGVDSSVAALLLKRAGYDVFALFMQNWHDLEGTLHGNCEWEEDRSVAEMVARKIGIPFHFVDLSDEYRRRVVDYMFDEYAKGRTPNPDVLCNREIKFDALLREARKLGADIVATGHYCRKDEFKDTDGKTVYRILEGSDPNKDQSYFLCQLSQSQLAAALFPIGNLLKPQVRELAREAGLPSAEKKDSQGICFVGKVDLPLFLQQKLAPQEGDIVEVFDAWYESDPEYLYDAAISARLDGGESPDTLSDEQLKRCSRPLDYSGIVFETESYRSGKKHVKKTRYKANPFGKIVGRHDGAKFYTIGQRHGLAVGGHSGSLFVIATDVQSNRVYVGEGQNHKGLYRRSLSIAPGDVHWIRPDLELSEGESLDCLVRIRYRQPLEKARLLRRRDALYIVFARNQRGITAGQFAVWYASDGEMLGSGVISA